MSAAQLQLPRLITTSVVRGSQQGESHGGVFLVDFAAQEATQVVDWNTGDIDWQGRGWDRGLRGIEFFGGEIYIAASDELFVYGQDFKIRRSYRCPYLKHCHEIHRLNNHLYLTSTGFDAILAFDLERLGFIWGIQLSVDESGEPSGRPFHPNKPGGPAARNQLHLNNIFANDHGLWISGMRTGGLWRISDGNVVDFMVELPQGIHNARPLGDGVIFNDTASDHLRYVMRDGSEQHFEVPKYDPPELTHTELGDENVARQGFGRGLCVINDEFVAAGSSPSTISLYHLPSGSRVAQVNLTMDIRNAIHGLEVYPY